MNIDYDTALEMANGFGFCLTTVLMVNLIFIFAHRIKERLWSWHSDVVAQLALGMILLKGGLAMRLGYAWLAYRYHAIESFSWILFASIGVIAVGGLLLLNVVTCGRWRPWVAIAAGMLSFLIPFIYYAFDLMFPVVTLSTPPFELIKGTYDPLRVVLSILIAVVGSYTALEIVQTARVSEGIVSAAWIFAAAFVFGWSVWSMHFVAMLAYELPFEVRYNVQLTILSLVVVIALTWVAFVATSTMRHNMNRFIPLAFSGVTIGIGIVAMHYVGMAAMEMAAIPSYTLPWVLASVGVAMAGASASIWIAFFMETTRLQKVFAAIIMGVFGISGLHYTAMLAYACRATGGHVDHTGGSFAMSQGTLALAVTGTSFLIILSLLLFVQYDRRV